MLLTIFATLVSVGIGFMIGLDVAAWIDGKPSFLALWNWITIMIYLFFPFCCIAAVLGAIERGKRTIYILFDEEDRKRVRKARVERAHLRLVRGGKNEGE